MGTRRYGEAGRTWPAHRQEPCRPSFWKLSAASVTQKANTNAAKSSPFRSNAAQSSAAQRRPRVLVLVLAQHTAQHSTSNTQSGTTERCEERDFVVLKELFRTSALLATCWWTAERHGY